MKKDPLRMTAKRGSFIVLGAIVLFADCVAHSTTPSNISSDLNGRDTSDQLDVIVQYRHVPTPQQHQKIVPLGGMLRQELLSIRGGAYRVTASALAELESDPEVLYVSADRAVHGTTISSPLPMLDYHTDAANAQAAWAQGLDGSGVGVAVIDSGIQDIPDFHGKKFAVIYSPDFLHHPAARGNPPHPPATPVTATLPPTRAH